MNSDQIHELEETHRTAIEKLSAIVINRQESSKGYRERSSINQCHKVSTATDSYSSTFLKALIEFTDIPEDSTVDHHHSSPHLLHDDHSSFVDAVTRNQSKL